MKEKEKSESINNTENNKINKSLRISLTEKCNYKCFFCHEEGLDMKSSRKSNKTKEEVYNLIQEGLRNGYKDITFTGGEPLLKLKDVIWYFRKLRESNENPDITIVTNGEYITDELIDEVHQYNGKAKFNISLHSLNPADYGRIICVPNENGRFEKVTQNIQKVKEKGIEVKLNFVLLKGINTEKDKIKEILEYGLKNNIDYIKFLELLVIEGKEEIYKYFTELEQIEESLKDEMILVTDKIARRKLYLYKNKLKIEIQKCTCSFGCNSCLRNRDVNVTAELKYYPCFILSNENYEISSEDFMNKVKMGNDKIREYAKKYKNDSPLLIKKKEYIEKKLEFYYEVNSEKDKNRIRELLEEEGYRIYETKETKERYYSSEESYEIKKLFIHSHNDIKYTEIIRNYLVNEKNGGIIIKFLNRGDTFKPEKIDNLTEYEKKLEKEESHYIRELDWEIAIFKNNDKTVSIGFEKTSKRIFILSPEKEIEDKILNKLQLIKMKELPIKYILKLEGKINE